MSRITGIGAGIGAGIAERTKPAAAPLGAGFSVDADSRAPAVRQNQPAQSLVLSGMLALQEAQAGTVQDKAARRHGIALLETLSQLQKALLAGPGDGAAEVATLALLANEMPAAADPGLATALAAIRLRAKIELLRRGVEIT